MNVNDPANFGVLRVTIVQLSGVAERMSDANCK